MILILCDFCINFDDDLNDCTIGAEIQPTPEGQKVLINGSCEDFVNKPFPLDAKGEEL